MNTSKLKAWIHAVRIHTLPLAIAGVLLASLLAYSQQLFKLDVFILALITTVLLQVLSNLANDYGDYSHGTDNDERIGPERALQSGLISPKEMKRGIYLVGLMAFHAGMFLLTAALDDIFNYIFILFLITGLVAIGAAIKYTIGKNPFGYKGFGDIMVFVFFGLASISGIYFLHTLTINWAILLPATSVGLLSAGVLNVNNMRDIENDKASNKITLAVKLGKTGSKIYHVLLITISIILFVAFLSLWQDTKMTVYLTIPSIPLVIHTIIVILNREPRKLDPQLKLLSLSTLLISLWVGIGLAFF